MKYLIFIYTYFLLYRIRVSKGLSSGDTWQMTEKICAAKLILLFHCTEYYDDPLKTKIVFSIGFHDFWVSSPSHKRHLPNIFLYHLPSATAGRTFGTRILYRKVLCQKDATWSAKDTFCHMEKFLNFPYGKKQLLYCGRRKACLWAIWRRRKILQAGFFFYFIREYFARRT